jgi:hypothetical protein
MKTFFVLVVLLLQCKVFAAMEFNDGLIHTIDSSIDGTLTVDYLTPGAGTVVNVIDGDYVPPAPNEPGFGLSVSAYENSVINLSGGWLYHVTTFDNSSLFMSGGLVINSGAKGGRVNIRGNSHAQISGGYISVVMFARDTSQVVISDGTVGALVTADAGQVSISGGSLGNVYSYGILPITITGGSVGFLSASSGSFNIYGTNFAIDGLPVEFGEIQSVTDGSSQPLEPMRWLTGTLANGDMINSRFQILHSGSIHLMSIPEPGTLWVLGLSLVTLVRQRRN